MEWIKNNIWQTLIVALIMAIFSAIGSIYVYKYTKKDEKANSAASTDYVDKKTGDLKTYIDVQDGEIKGHIQALDNRIETKADKADIMEIRGLIKQQNEYLFTIIRQTK